MSYFEWQDGFSVNVKEIDDQHKKIIEMINEIQAALFEEASLDVQRKVVYGMVEYSSVHFLTEEKYMEDFKFANDDEHIAEHNKFREHSRQLKQKIQDSGFVLSMELLTYLKSWWKNHILVTDMKYVDTFNKNGLK